MRRSFLMALLSLSLLVPLGCNKPSNVNPVAEVSKHESPEPQQVAVPQVAMPRTEIETFTGRWQIVDAASGKTANFFTLTSSFDARKSNVPNATGKWEVVGNEARITWSDGWRDVLRPQPRNEGYLKIAFAPQTSWNDSPANIKRAIKGGVETAARDKSPAKSKTTPPSVKQLSSTELRAIYSGIGTGTILKEVEDKLGPLSNRSLDSSHVTSPYEVMLATWELKSSDHPEQLTIITVRFFAIPIERYGSPWQYNGHKSYDGP